MAGEISIDLSGMDDLEAALSGAADNLLSHLENDTGALIREVMSTHAKNLAPVNKQGMGGTLRQMIDSSGEGDAIRDGDTVAITITSHADYSIFVEYGTGFRGDPAIPHTNKRIWFQRNPDFHDGDIETPEHPRFIPRYPQKPQPFMRPAVEMSIPEAKKIIAGQLKEVFNE